ncbi:MAG: hypothetical protein JWO91_1101 [Acidobacteriaceae bacterium]|nr:hypothetical protein [Acidobacteriaceae bacterium]
MRSETSIWSMKLGEVFFVRSVAEQFEPAPHCMHCVNVTLPRQIRRPHRIGVLRSTERILIVAQFPRPELRHLCTATRRRVPGLYILRASYNLIAIKYKRHIMETE